MPREIIDHKTNSANDRLTITATDEPGPGGANHRYEITGFATYGNPYLSQPPITRTFLSFQNGAIAEVGVNGITQEALIAICIDRLRSFQAGRFACRENALALTKLEEALHWLHHRTQARMRRGVEGALKP